MHITISRGHGTQRHAGGRRAHITLWLSTVGCLSTLALGLLAALPVAAAPPPAKIARVGVLRPGSPPNPQREVFREALHALRYVEGQNLVLEERWAEGHPERLPFLAAELVRLPVDVLVVTSHRAALIAKEATTTLPIVFAGVNDPVGVGLVASLAHPGGNVTGVSLQGVELIGKRLQLLKEAAPTFSHVAYLRNPTEPYSAAYWREVQVGTVALGGHPPRSIEVRGPEDFAQAWTEMARWRPDVLLVEPNTLNFASRARIAAFTAEHRIPTMYGLGLFMDAGGLMAYGPSLSEHYRRAAAYVDKILQGARPIELPVEQPTKFALVINLKTAQALGLTLPPSILVQADEGIK